MNMPERVEELSWFLVEQGLRPLIVGGAVIDIIQGREPKDWDIEVYGSSLEDLQMALESGGFRCKTAGAKFGILVVGDMDVSIPRRDNKIGKGHKGFEVEFDPDMTPEDGARRRDFTINSMYYDVVLDEIIDPFGGLQDLEDGILRATDPLHFIEDPLRVLRAMQLLARKAKSIAETTMDLVRGMVDSFSELAPERVYEEFRKLLLRADRPSIGLWFLRQSGWLVHFPELHALIGCEQHPEWHPEGWSVEFFPLSAKSLGTSMAEPDSIDLRLALGQLISGSLTEPTVVPRLGSASTAESVVDLASNSFSSTHSTGTDGVLISEKSGVAVSAETTGLVLRFGRPTISTDKVLRVMFEVPISRMRSIVRSAVDDFEVIETVVHPVAIYVMNMFGSLESSTDLQFHKVAMKSSTVPLATGNVHIDVSSVIVDLESLSVDNDILFNLDFTLKGDTDFIHITDLPGGIVDDNTNLLMCQVSIGDVWQHTMKVVDAAAAIRDRVPEEWRAAFMFGAMLHDIGKPSTTTPDMHAYGHDTEGGPMAEAFMRRMSAGKETIARVTAIVGNHMQPFQLSDGNAKTAAWKRLHNKCRLDIMGYMSHADRTGTKIGRKVEDENPRLDLCLAYFEKFGEEPIAPVLMGRHLIDAGFKPGPQFKPLLNKAYEAQLENPELGVEELLTLVKGDP